ncbi:MAG TPA: ABC transporter permease [Candidatus Methylomirabilis sp.]|nr:ABC transporter permease [Candidatus Methylomirabilis sp.]
MKLFASIRAITTAVFRRRRAEREMEEELRAHIEQRADDLVRDGMARAEAERRARIEFGGGEKYKEECREARGDLWLETLWMDARYALRTLRRSPGFTAVVVLTLALGIGANSAIFSVLDAVLLRPLPYRDPDKLVTIFESKTPNDTSSTNAVAPGNFLDWRKQNRVFEQIGAASLPGFNFTGTDRAERVTGAAISAGMLQMLGLRAALGRDFEPSEDREGADRVVILGNGLWQRRYGSDADIVGKTIHLDTKPYTVIGVLPRGLTFPEDSVQLWVPLEQYISAQNMEWRNSHYLDVFARLKPSVTLAQARAEMNEIAESIKRANPGTNSGSGAHIVRVQEDLVSDIRPALLTLLVAVGFVLLVACANVANLLLVRATGREKEISVRVALGAGTGRLVRQMLTESVLLSAAGGAMGLLVAEWARETLLALRPVSLPRYNAIEIDGRVLLYTLGVSLITGVLFGLAPALRATRSDASLALRGRSRVAAGGAGPQRLRAAFVVGEIAISLVLLIGAGLLIRSFMRLRSGELGFRMDHIVTARVSIPEEKYPDDAQVSRFYDQLLEKVRAVPGVEQAGTISFLPLTGRQFDNSFDIVGRPPQGHAGKTFALIRFVDPQCFNVLQIGILRGRGVEARDRQGAPRTVVISEAMAKRYWSNENPVGQHLIVYMGLDQSPWEIVGVVRDVRSNVAALPEPTIYFSYEQFPYRFLVLTVLTHSDPKAMIEALRGVTRTLDPDQPLSQVRTMEQLMEQTLLPWRFSMTLLGAFAALALVLAAAGIYGVISYTVGMRTGEIGVRMVLGAQARDVRRLILRQGMGVTLFGIVLGLAGALLLTGYLTTQLYGVHARDPLTFVAVPGLLAAVALVANYIPARRATRVDPMVALRHE